jgi:hypothetical protein
MEEQLIKFDTAKLAKEKGFDCKSNFYNWYGSDKILNQMYDLENIILAPTQSLLQKWLREKHKILVEATHFTAEYFTYNLYKRDNIIYILKLGGLDNICNTYEEALEKGLQEALKLIGNGK